MRLEMKKRFLHGLDAGSINTCAAEFWRHESKRASERCSDPDILEHATQILRSEEQRFVPVSYRNSLESALETAARHEERVQQRLVAVARSAREGFIAREEHERLIGAAEKTGVKRTASKAGSAPKNDALRNLILEILKKKPLANRSEILDALDAVRGHGVIDEIGQKYIEYFDKEQIKKASLSGLDDRILRLKKKLMPL
jgi:hypothetical protein